MKKLIALFMAAGFTLILLTGSAYSQMMNNQMQNQANRQDMNADQQTEHGYMADMMNMQDSIAEQCSMISTDFDSLETDFNRIMNISDKEKMMNEMNKYKYQMLSLEDRLSRLESMEVQMKKKIEGRRMVHSMHTMMHEIFGEYSPDQETR